MTRLDPYAVLGIEPGASEAEIRAAYRAAMRRAHPDSGGSGDAEQVAAIADAWHALRRANSRLAGGATPRAATPSAARTVRPTPTPARFPWRFMAGMAAFGVLALIVGRATVGPLEPTDGGVLVRPGSCVVLEANGDARAVPCTGDYDGVAADLVGFDQSCVYPANPHRDVQGRGWVCVVPGSEP